MARTPEIPEDLDAQINETVTRADCNWITSLVGLIDQLCGRRFSPRVEYSVKKHIKAANRSLNSSIPEGANYGWEAQEHVGGVTVYRKGEAPKRDNFNSGDTW